MVLASAIITISTPLAGNFGDIAWTKNPAVETIPIIVSLSDNTAVGEDLSEVDFKLISAYNPANLFEDRSIEQKIGIKSEDITRVSSSSSFIAEMYYDEKTGYPVIGSISATDPILYFPANPALNQKIKNMNFHVPMSWVATLAFMIGAIFGAVYLAKGQYKHDSISVSSNLVGLIFASIAMLTGMLWAKFNWGMWWSNDPKQVSLAVLLLIYFAFFALRTAMPDGPKLNKISSVYSIIAFVSSIFFLFVLPRISPSLHPGGGSDKDLGPAVSFGEGILDSNLALIFYMSVFSYILIYFWLAGLVARTRIAERNVKELEEVI